MCCLFGILDCGQVLSAGQRNMILSVLAIESEIRGIDATGIAYNANGLRIYKHPKPAHKMRFRLPKEAHHIIGHTRMTTQGDEKYNRNNHPFSGSVNGHSFALAHNGVLHNDYELRTTLGLPKTPVETDSYVMVQMLEQCDKLSAAALGTMAEQLQGTFTVTVLDEGNRFYVIRGNNPFCLAYWERWNLYIYASTEAILKSALAKIPYLDHPEIVPLQMGEILQIESDGTRSLSHFVMPEATPYSPLWGAYPWTPITKRNDTIYVSNLKHLASQFGFTPSDVDSLLAEGMAPDEIEAFFYGEEF